MRTADTGLGERAPDASRRPSCTPLSHTAIDATVVRSVAGTYQLGYLDGGSFVAFYVGRADADLCACLHRWVGVEAPADARGRGATAPRSARRRPSFPPCDTPTMRSIGPAVDARYTHFRFAYALSARAAFENECASYHALGEERLDNTHHPVRPDGTDWECPHAHPRT